MMRLSLTEFAEKLNEIFPVIMKELLQRQVNDLYKGKITLPQFLILEFLHKQKALKMSDLADCMSVTTAAITGIVDRLVKSGYLVRNYDPQDRRVIKVSLTRKGDDLVNRIISQKQQIVIDMFGQLPETDRREYLRILLRIKEILLKEKKQ